jgi:arsenate reductase
VEYLKIRLDRATLARLLDRLGVPPAELVRKDKRFTELGLNADDTTTTESVIALLLEHPELMQRPIVVAGNRAIIARPAERVTELLD